MPGLSSLQVVWGLISNPFIPMNLTKPALYGLLVLIMGSNHHCAPKDWDYRSREYVARKNLDGKIPFASASEQTYDLIISPEKIRDALGLNEQLDDPWAGENMTYTLKSVKVESCSVDIKVSENNQALTLNFEGTVTVSGSNTNIPLFNNGKVALLLNKTAVTSLSAKLNKNAVSEVQKTISDNIKNLNKGLTIKIKASPVPTNKVALAEVILNLGVTATYDICQLMPPGSGGEKCK